MTYRGGPQPLRGVIIPNTYKLRGGEIRRVVFSTIGIKDIERKRGDLVCYHFSTVKRGYRRTRGNGGNAFGAICLQRDMSVDAICLRRDMPAGRGGTPHPAQAPPSPQGEGLVLLARPVTMRRREGKDAEFALAIRICRNVLRAVSFPQTLRWIVWGKRCRPKNPFEEASLRATRKRDSTATGSRTGRGKRIQIKKKKTSRGTAGGFQP